jgi:hypothetical protein
MPFESKRPAFGNEQQFPRNSPATAKTSHCRLDGRIAARRQEHRYEPKVKAGEI